MARTVLKVYGHYSVHADAGLLIYLLQRDGLCAWCEYCSVSDFEHLLNSAVEHTVDDDNDVIDPENNPICTSAIHNIPRLGMK
jgi:hypothetical protein